MKRILVTGGLGFIGSHTVVELQKEGFEVIVIDNLCNSQAFILDRIEMITGNRPVFYQTDMCDKMEMIEMFKKEKYFDVIIHFAALKAVGESVKEPLKYFQNNLISLMNLLDCMEANNCKNLVFSSSATVYGDPDEFPVKESAAFKKALSAYGSTKQIGEELIEKVCATGNANAISLRYFNPVGAHESGLIGELPIGLPNNLMPFITQTAAGLREKLTVFGNEFPTSDGTCVRDYIHVVDLAVAHVLSCVRLINEKQKSNYEVFNIGTGNGNSVLEVINAFEKANHLKLNYTIGQKREGDVAVLYADGSLAEKELGWRAKLGLQEMVTSAWLWQQRLKENL